MINKEFKGVAIKIRSGNGYSAAQIINMHYNALMQSKDKLVCFSSNIPFASSRKFSELLLYFQNKGKLDFVICEIEKFSHEKPENYNDLCPKNFLNEENKKAYFIIKSMHIASKSELDEYVVNYDNGDELPLIDVIQFPRTNRVYYSEKGSSTPQNEEFILIK